MVRLAGKKPFTFTAASYVVDKTGGGSVRRRRETAFAQEPSPKGTFRFRQAGVTAFMTEEEQAELDGKMMEAAGAAVSDYLSGRPG